MQFKKHLIGFTVCALLSACGGSKSETTSTSHSATTSHSAAGAGAISKEKQARVGYAHDSLKCSLAFTEEAIKLNSAEDLEAFGNKYSGLICLADGNEFNVDRFVSLAKKFLSEEKLSDDEEKTFDEYELSLKKHAKVVKTNALANFENQPAVIRHSTQPTKEKAERRSATALGSRQIGPFNARRLVLPQRMQAAVDQLKDSEQDEIGLHAMNIDPAGPAGEVADDFEAEALIVE
jgi:hypothetical protein